MFFRKEMHKVLFVGDLYRPGQTENIVRTCNCFSPVLKEIGIKYELHVSKQNQQETNNETFALWEQSLVGNGFKSELSALDLKGYFIIGFEISKVDINYLNKEGYDWINLSIHPLRFMDDLYFSVESSMDLDLSRNSVSTGFIDMSVKVLSQRYSLNFGKQETKKTLCILGQRQDDKSVFINNTFKKLEDYTEKLDSIVNEFDELLYKPHPYNDDNKADQFIQDRYQAKTLNEDDIYKVFSQKTISSFCAISSSLLYEAKLFGIESIFLDKSPLKFGHPVSYRLLIEDETFWSKVFKTSNSFTLKNLSQSLPYNYLRKVYAKWSYHTEEDLLFAEINKFQKTKLDHELYLLKKSNEESVSSLTEKISDLENKNGFLGNLVNEAYAQAAQAEENAKNAKQLIEESKKLLCQAIAKHDHLAQDLSHIKASGLWRLVNPFFQLEDLFTNFLKERKRYKVYRNIRVPWHKHLYRAFAVLLHKSDKPWHTHLYRCVYSLMGNEKYSVKNNKKKEIIDNNVHIKNKCIGLTKNGLKVLQFTNYKLDDYNQGGKIRCYEIRNTLLKSGYDVITLSFGLGNCDQLEDYHLEVDKSLFFEKVKDGTIADWAICEYILKNELLLLNLRKFTKKFNPDIVLLEQPFLWPIVNELLEGGFIDKRCLLVNSTHNIEFKLKECIYQNVFNSILAEKYISIVRSMEEYATKSSDITLCVSEIDYNYFKSLNNNVQTVILPNGTKKCTDFDSGSWDKRFKGTKNNWVFVASWHQPNIDGILRLINGGLESFDAKQTKLWIFGSVVHPLSEFIKNHSKSSSVIQLIGECSDSEIAGAIQSSTGIILPIWQGGGSNLKTAQALLSGKFIISTSYAFRGYEQFISTNQLEIIDEETSFANQMLLEVYPNDIVKRSGVENLEWCKIMSNLPFILSQHYFNKNIGFKLDKVYFEITSVYKSMGLCSGITRVVSKLAKNFYSFNKDVYFVVFDSNLKKFLEIDIKTMILKRSSVSFDQNSTFFSFCNTWDYENYEIGLEEISKKCSKVIYFIHDLIPCKMPHAFGPGLTQKYHNWLTLILKNGTQFLTNSEFSKRDILEFIKKHNLRHNLKIDVIRLGDCIGSHKFISKKNIREPYLLSVGTVEFRKNHQVLLDAYRILLQDQSLSIPQLIIAGKQGWMDNHILHQIKHDRLLKSNVEVLHNLSDEKLNDLYENCLFTLYPSFYEGWGLPVAESFAHGKVCIISNESSMSEICPDITIEIDPLDPYKWSREIKELIINKSKLNSLEKLIEEKYKRQNWSNTTFDIISKVS